MNYSTVLSGIGDLSFSNAVHPRLRKRFWCRFELGVIAFILLLLNWPLLKGMCNTAMIFLPEPVREGEWWRLLSHPFVHVTWYHLLLDGTAFFVLYKDLQDQPWIKRFVLVLASGLGSLAVSLWGDPMVSVKGLCGLSGIAHGLMATSALDLMSQRRDKMLFWIGLFCFALVLVKSLLEVLTGKMLFAFLYFGLVGSPIAVTHAGGVLGGLVAWLSFGFVGRCRVST
jgi:rhomboid family GlyGly-CTERM serine protease